VADFSLDVAMSPDAAVMRVRSAINRPKKRMFGVLKTNAEYVGVADGRAFEIWERQQRAVHAFGEVEGIRGGGRVQVRFFFPPRTRILLGLFFVLYAIAAVGITARGEDGLSGVDAVLVVAGAIVLAGLFQIAALRQRADLRSFIEGVFRDTPRV